MHKKCQACCRYTRNVIHCYIRTFNGGFGGSAITTFKSRVSHFTKIKENLRENAAQQNDSCLDCRVLIADILLGGGACRRVRLHGR